MAGAAPAARWRDRVGLDDQKGDDHLAMLFCNPFCRGLHCLGDRAGHFAMQPQPRGPQSAVGGA